MPPTVAQLTTAHPLHKANAHWWGLLTRLVEGGRSLTKDDKEVLLKHPDNRGPALRQKRAEVAHHSPLLAGMMTKLQAQITRSPANYIPTREGSTATSSDEFWGDFMNNTTLDGAEFGSLHGQLSNAMLCALTTGAAYIQVDTLPTPEARNRAEQRELGGDRPFLVLHDRSGLQDWGMGHKGFDFAHLHYQDIWRDGWGSRPLPVHRYQIYERKPDGSVSSQSWRIRPKSRDVTSFVPSSDDIVEEILPESEVFHLITPQGKRTLFPVVPLNIPKPLAVGPQLFDTYSQFFSQMAGINYSSLVSLWRQLIFTGVRNEEDVLNAISKGAGDGFYWALQPGIEAKWLETDTQGLEFAMRYADILKSEMLDSVSQIAASAAATYAGLSRSGVSKKEDRRNMDILLEVYGVALRGLAKRVLDCASIARGEALNWSVEGFAKYDSDGLLDDLAEFTASAPVIKSPTYDREARKALAASAVHALGIPPSSLTTILNEINDELDEVEPDAEG